MKENYEIMGYWVYLQEARVEIPRERQPLAIATLKRLVGDFPWVTNERYFNAETFAETLQDLRWRPVQDREGNVFTLEFWQTRLEAARALGKLEGPIPHTTLDQLLEVCNDRESSAVREAAREALEAILAREADILEDLPPS